MFVFKNRTTLSCAPDAEFHAQIARRDFLVQTVNSVKGLSILAVCPALFLAGFSGAAEVVADDPRIRTQRLAIGVQWGKLECYLARPIVDTAPLPAVIVAHDRLGLTPHFEDIARRLALEGFVALAPDYASRFGGTPSEPGPAIEVVGMTKDQDMAADTQVALQWLKAQGRQHIGALGFGRGGTAISYAAARLPNLMAAAVYYGHPTPIADIGRLRVPLLFNLAGKDQFVDPEIPAFVEALKKANVKFELYTYEGTVRGFDDDSATAHYSPDAAKLAWLRTIAFLKAALI
jgi:carboxymethylenebutenolidase